MAEKKKWLPTELRTIPADEGIRHILQETIKFGWPFVAAGGLSVSTWLWGRVPSLSSVEWTFVFLGFTIIIFLTWGIYEYVGLVRIRKKNSKEPVQPVAAFGFAEAMDPEFQKRQAEACKINLPREHYSPKESDCIAEALTEIADLSHGLFGKLMDKTQDVWQQADKGSEDQIRASINDFVSAAIAFNRKVDNEDNGIRYKYSPFSREIDPVLQWNSLQQNVAELSNAVHMLAYAALSLKMIPPQVSSEDRQNFRSALRVHFTNVHQSRERLGLWKKNVASKRDAVLEAVLMVAKR
jgi:hypothetical protein